MMHCTVAEPVRVLVHERASIQLQASNVNDISTATYERSEKNAGRSSRRSDSCTHGIVSAAAGYLYLLHRTCAIYISL